MEQMYKQTGSGFFGIIALGIIMILLGIPFIGMTVMTVMLSAPNSRMGLTLAIATLFGVYLISDFTGALIAATGSGFLIAGMKSGRNSQSSFSIAAAAVALVSVFGTLMIPHQSLLSQENMEALLQLYRSAGLSSTEINLILNIFLYLMPSLLALWAVAGTIAAGSAARLINRRRNVVLNIQTGKEIRLGLLPAWILIVALAVNLPGIMDFSPYLRQVAVNISVFMILPYSAVGIIVCRAVLRSYPQLLIVIVLIAILFPPVVICLLALAGILDTWLDFRSLLKKIKERKEQQ